MTAHQKTLAPSLLTTTKMLSAFRSSQITLVSSNCVSVRVDAHVMLQSHLTGSGERPDGYHTNWFIRHQGTSSRDRVTSPGLKLTLLGHRRHKRPYYAATCVLPFHD